MLDKLLNIHSFYHDIVQKTIKGCKEILWKKNNQEVILRQQCVFLARSRTEHTSKAKTQKNELYSVTVNYEENKVFLSNDFFQKFPDMQNLPICAYARWGKFFADSGTFWKIIDHKIFFYRWFYCVEFRTHSSCIDFMI